MDEAAVIARIKELKAEGLALRAIREKIHAEGGPLYSPKTITARLNKPTAGQLDHIAPELRQLAIPCSGLRFDPRNPNSHPEAQKAALRASLKEFGQLKPIVANTLQSGKPIVIAGNATLEAALALGWTHIAVNRVNVSETVAAAYSAADKAITDMSEWNLANLAAILVELEDEPIDMFALGFDDDFVKKALEAAQGGGSEGKDDGTGKTPSGDEWESSLNGLPTGDKSPFQQMTFTLHDTQAETVKRALKASLGMGAFVGPNENSNGNALARICESFLEKINEC
jgi:hypothetical protein